MKINKKTLIIILTLTTILISILTLILLKQKNPSPPPPPSIPSPRFETSSINQQTPIFIKNQTNELNIPKSLPVYTLDITPLTLLESTNIAQKLGFNDQPTTLQDSLTGTVYLWSNENSSLLITPQLHLIDYKSTPTENNTLNIPFANNQELINIATNFITKYNFISSQEIEFDQIIFFKNAVNQIQPTTKSQSDIAAVIFNQKLNQFPIINTDPQDYLINIKVDKQKQVVAATLRLFNPPLSQSNYPLKDLNQIQNSINKSQLQSLTNDYGGSDNINSSQINRIDTTSLKVAYLLENQSGQNFLQPIFIFQATIST